MSRIFAVFRHRAQAMVTVTVVAMAALTMLIADGAVSPARADDSWQAIEARGLLRIATVTDRAPLSDRTESGAFVGFDVEVARAIAERLGVKPVFVAPSWDAITGGDWGGAWDVAVAAITPTAPRMKHLDFPQTYAFIPVVVAVGRGPAGEPANPSAGVTRPEQASGRRIGVMAGTTHEQYLNHDLTLFDDEEPVTYRIQDPVVVPFDSETDLFAALDADAPLIDAAVVSLPSALAAQERDERIRILEGILFMEPVAVAVPKGADALSERLIAVIEQMEEDGVIGALSLRWFGIDITL